MKTIRATYKGARIVELFEDIKLPQDLPVYVMIPDDEDEKELRNQFQRAAQLAFAKVWDNAADEVWNEYS